MRKREFLNQLPTQTLAFLLRLQGFQDGIQEESFGKRSFDVGLTVDHRLGDGVDAVLAGQVAKLRGFDAIGSDQVTLHGKLIGQAHGPRTMGSRGRGEDFKVEWLG